MIADKNINIPEGKHLPKKPGVSLFLLLVLCLVPAWALADESVGTPLEAAWAPAQKQVLYEKPYWLTLCHYKKTFTGYQSLIDDPAFFLSPHGKTNPKAEMQATIRAFLQEEQSPDNRPACRFPARLAWLKENLPKAPWPHMDSLCEKLLEWQKTLAPESVTLVFPSAYMNNPASMFGHTFLTINHASGSLLTSHTVNYSASTPDRLGPAYAIKGILGFYKAYFSVAPYYEKLAEYQDASYRDIWEYRTNLDLVEIRRLLLHLWELDGVYTDYYFFDENCSFGLLFLLDAARPSLGLTQQTGPWVTPVDTLRLARESGLFTEIDYRPSITARIDHLARPLDQETQKTVLAVIAGKVPIGNLADQDMPDHEKIKTLDLMAEALKYKYQKREILKDRYIPLYRETLKARSRLGRADDQVWPRPASPDSGHLPARFFFGAGSRDGQAFSRLAFRPVYHDLTDNPRGYVPGAKIQLLAAEARYYFDEAQWELEKLSLLDVESLSVRNRFLKPLSWKISLGLIRQLDRQGDTAPAWELAGGWGLAREIPGQGLAYGMGLARAAAGRDLDQGYAVGAGAEAGVLFNISNRIVIHGKIAGLNHFLGDRYDTIKALVSGNLSVAPNTSLALEWSWEKAHRYTTDGIWIGTRVYF